MLKATAIFRPRSDIGRFVEVKITPAVRKAVEEVADLVYDRSQELVPVDTGALKSSGTKNIEELDKTIRGTVDYTVEYAPYVEFGTGIRGAQSEGAGQGPYDPNWPGMAAQPFIRPALDEAKTQAEDVFRNHLGTALES